jgi:hypothetical protein
MKRWIRGDRQPVRVLIVKFIPLDATTCAQTKVRRTHRVAGRPQTALPGTAHNHLTGAGGEDIWLGWATVQNEKTVVGLRLRTSVGTIAARDAEAPVGRQATAFLQYSIVSSLIAGRDLFRSSS